ncbi:MAG: Gfo/Idh/MocA family oxidoreductase [Actinobacteria bacterium]|nr:Gfo/Idh/MocA family oxidoreductase [Actinomycetota bacterium]
MANLRIGFVGCGYFATGTMWPSLRYAPIEVAYAAARGPERAEANAKKFGAERATTDLREILDDESVTAVFVVGPPAMHHEVGLQVLEAGKHLFVEKPVAATLAQALELQDAAERNGVQCQVGFQKRFALGYVMAKEAAAKEDFGGATLCKVNYSHWRMADWNSHLSVMSVHGLDLVRYFMGDPHEAHVLKRSHKDGAHTCVLTLLYESGASAVVNLSANDPHVQEWVELSGAGRLISVRNLAEYQEWSEGGSPMTTLTTSAPGVSLWHPQFAVPYRQADTMWLQGYAGEVVDFAQAILEGRPVSPSIADGVVSMRYVNAIVNAPEGMSELKLDGGVL